MSENPETVVEEFDYELPDEVVIEIDGSGHARQPNVDRERDRLLRAAKIDVVRVEGKESLDVEALMQRLDLGPHEPRVAHLSASGRELRRMLLAPAELHRLGLGIVLSVVWPPVQAGINVFSVDTYIGDNGGDYTSGDVTFPLSYIGSDNVQGGKVACQAVIDAMGGAGKMYIQNVKPGISTTDQREQGCKEAIDATGGKVELEALALSIYQIAVAVFLAKAKLGQQLNGIFAYLPGINLNGVFTVF